LNARITSSHLFLSWIEKTALSTLEKLAGKGRFESGGERIPRSLPRGTRANHVELFFLRFGASQELAPEKLQMSAFLYFDSGHGCGTDLNRRFGSSAAETWNDSR